MSRDQAITGDLSFLSFISYSLHGEVDSENETTTKGKVETGLKAESLDIFPLVLGLLWIIFS